MIHFTVKMKINATELKNFSISESKFKSQTKQHCTTALQKYAPKMKSLLGLYGEHFYTVKEKALNRSILCCYLLPYFFRYSF